MLFTTLWRTRTDAKIRPVLVALQAAPIHKLYHVDCLDLDRLDGRDLHQHTCFKQCANRLNRHDLRPFAGASVRPTAFHRCTALAMVWLRRCADILTALIGTHAPRCQKAGRSPTHVIYGYLC